MPSRTSSPVAARSTEGDVVADFIETACRITKGAEAGAPIVLRPWQRGLLEDLFELRPDGRRRYRQALVGLPRKNGKSALGSGIALYGLFDEPGSEVYSCAGDKEQATTLAREATRALDKAASKGVIHANQAANRKSAMGKAAAAL